MADNSSDSTVDTLVAGVSAANTSVADTSSADTSVGDTSVGDTSVADTSVADTSVGDSWEEAADSGELERRMEARERDLQKREHLVVTTVTEKPVTILRSSENGGRTEYTPQIRILRRSPNEGKKVKVPQKTEEEMKQDLKQKEAKYMAARNRILGENYDETKPKLDVKPEDSNGRITIIKNPSRNTSPVTTNGAVLSPSSISSSERSLASP